MISSRLSTRCRFRLSLTHFIDSGLSVRKVGQASLQRPHSVHVNASSPSFQVRSFAVRTPTRIASASAPSPIIFSRSMKGTVFAGLPRRKNSAGSAVTIWKCSPVGSRTRKAKTTTSCVQ